MYDIKNVECKFCCSKIDYLKINGDMLIAHCKECEYRTEFYAHERGYIAGRAWMLRFLEEKHANGTLIEWLDRDKGEKNKMYRILHHMDADGYASAAVVFKNLNEEHLVSSKDIVFHPINYGMPIPEEINYKKDTVYMVDFSLQPLAIMVNFAKKLGKRLVWIDHHSTSVDMENEDVSLREVNGIRKVQDINGPISGCELTWFYFFKNEKIPRVLKLVGDWDVWRWKNLPKEEADTVQELQYFLRSIESNPSKEEGLHSWLNLLAYKDNLSEQASEKGRILLEYQRKQWSRLMKAKAFEATFCGFNAVMVNTSGGSEMFNSVFDPEKHDVMISFQMVNGKYLTVSLYGVNPNIHMGNLAKKTGEAGDFPSGGGHAGAAGFQCSWDYFKTLYTLKEDSSE